MLTSTLTLGDWGFFSSTLLPLPRLRRFQITEYILLERVGVQPQHRPALIVRQINHPHAIGPFRRVRQQFGQPVGLLVEKGFVQAVVFPLRKQRQIQD